MGKLHVEHITVLLIFMPTSHVQYFCIVHIGIVHLLCTLLLVT